MHNNLRLSFCPCSNGDGRTGVFLSLCLSIERLDTEDTVDIFQTVRWLRSQRAGLVSNAVSSKVACGPNKLLVPRAIRVSQPAGHWHEKRSFWFPGPAKRLRLLQGENELYPGSELLRKHLVMTVEYCYCSLILPNLSILQCALCQSMYAFLQSGFQLSVESSR